MNMTREQKVARMIIEDIEDVKYAMYDHDFEFLRIVLSGDNGWRPYNQLTDAEIDKEYIDRCYDEVDIDALES